MPKRDIFTLKEWADRHDVRNAYIEPDEAWVESLKRRTRMIYDAKIHHPMWRKG